MLNKKIFLAIVLLFSFFFILGCDEKIPGMPVTASAVIGSTTCMSIAEFNAGTYDGNILSIDGNKICVTKPSDLNGGPGSQDLQSVTGVGNTTDKNIITQDTLFARNILSNGGSNHWVWTDADGGGYVYNMFISGDGTPVGIQNTASNAGSNLAMFDYLGHYRAFFGWGNPGAGIFANAFSIVTFTNNPIFFGINQVIYGRMNKEQFDWTGNISVTDQAYGSSWDGDRNVPTKNALYDKIQTLGGSGIVFPLHDGNLFDINSMKLIDGNLNIDLNANNHDGNGFDVLSGKTICISGDCRTSFPTSGSGKNDLNQFVGQNAWSVYYTNSDGNYTALPIGDGNTILYSNGAANAPSWQPYFDTNDTAQAEILTQNFATSTYNVVKLSNQIGRFDNNTFTPDKNGIYNVSGIISLINSTTNTNRDILFMLTTTATPTSALISIRYFPITMNAGQIVGFSFSGDIRLTAGISYNYILYVGGTSSGTTSASSQKNIVSITRVNG